MRATFQPNAAASIRSLRGETATTSLVLTDLFPIEGDSPQISPQITWIEIRFLCWIDSFRADISAHSDLMFCGLEQRQIAI